MKKINKSQIANLESQISNFKSQSNMLEAQLHDDRLILAQLAR
jgi:hypothetical protein